MFRSRIFANIECIETQPLRIPIFHRCADRAAIADRPHWDYLRFPSSDRFHARDRFVPEATSGGRPADEPIGDNACDCTISQEVDPFRIQRGRKSHVWQRRNEDTDQNFPRTALWNARALGARRLRYLSQKELESAGTRLRKPETLSLCSDTSGTHNALSVASSNLA